MLKIIARLWWAGSSWAIARIVGPVRRRRLIAFSGPVRRRQLLAYSGPVRRRRLIALKGPFSTKLEVQAKVSLRETLA